MKTSTVRSASIEQIKGVSNLVGLPLDDLEQMSNVDIARVWMNLYELYPFYFGEATAWA